MTGPVFLSTTLLEGTTGVFEFEVVDKDGQGISAVVVEALTLTYYDVETAAPINARLNQDAYNTNQVTIATVAGPPMVTTVTWTLQPADTVLLNATHRLEWRGVLFQWTWNSGTEHNAYWAQFAIVNLPFVP
jgi:hypothetical protein